MSERRFIRTHFASDNYSGICPEAWAAMAEANAGHQVSYGNDDWTQRTADLLREVFETDCEVFFALTEEARRFGLRVHMDGARFANAVASLNLSPAEATWKSGVDVLCFGGSKNGIAVVEAVVFFDRELAAEFDYRCKQGGQLASKMRFLSAPWTGMLRDGAWLKHAQHANAMAKRLEAGLRALPQITVAYSVDSNAVFATIPEPLVEAMHARGWKFYTQVGGWQEARLMCRWDTTPEDVENFLADLKELIARGA